MDDYAGAFGFREWPFRIVVDESFAHIWADRKEVLRSIQLRLRRMGGLPYSTVQLLWADFGAGKSHTLRYLEAACGQNASNPLFPVYNELPVSLDGLIGLYRSFVNGLSPTFMQAIEQVVAQNKASPPRTQGARDLWQAFRLIGSNDFSAQALGLEWLQAPPKVPHLGTLKASGISGRIEEESRVVEIVAELVRLLRTIFPSAALVWLIDEYQRTADMQPRKRDGLAKAMVSLFNSCNTGLHLVLSFSVAQQDTALQLLPPDLQSRARAFPILALPFLGTDDAILFCRELLEAFRMEVEVCKDNPYYPFTEKSIRLIVGFVDKDSNNRTTPRRLMEVMSAVLLGQYEGQPLGSMVLPVDHDAVGETIHSVWGTPLPRQA